VAFGVSSEVAGAIKLCADFRGGHIARTLPRLTRVAEGRKMEGNTQENKRRIYPSRFSFMILFISQKL
jgi:hypothetical protein